DMVLLGQSGQERIAQHVATGTMEEQEIAALAAFHHLDAHPGGLERDKSWFHSSLEGARNASCARAASSRENCAAGVARAYDHSAAAFSATRSCIGWIQKRSS